MEMDDGERLASPKIEDLDEINNGSDECSNGTAFREFGGSRQIFSFFHALQHKDFLKSLSFDG